MIDRYSQPEMQAIWSEKNKFSIMLEVEVLACEAMAELGEIPREAAKTIREKADFDVDRIKEIERVTKHDLIAFVSSVAEYVGEDAKYIHLGMTSSDVLDTSFSVQLRQAGLLILDRVDRLIEVLKKQAVRYKDTLAMGRTHGVYAEPVTFGLKLAMWYTEMCRQRERLVRAIDNVSVGAISGAVGTFANIDPQIEAYVCEHLSLR
ncbi:MAG: lyase family protein, partial [Clostridia bacterium]|nr:lyase family protein [Clostridia bacterium]